MERLNLGKYIGPVFQKAICEDDFQTVQKLTILMDFRKVVLLDETVMGKPVHKSVLVFAAEHASVEMVEWLLKLGCSVNDLDSDGNTPLMAAVKMERLDMVRFLVKQPEVDFLCENKFRETALSLAKSCDTGELSSILTPIVQKAKTAQVSESFRAEGFSGTC